MIRKRWRLFAWSLLSAALLVLACWPLIIWWHVSNGVPLMPAAFETLLWPLAALGLGLAARGVWAACRPAVTSSGPAARPAARTIRRTPDPQRLLRRSGAGAGASLGAPSATRLNASASSRHALASLSIKSRCLGSSAFAAERMHSSA